MLKVLDTIVGHASDREIAEALHDLDHSGRVEYLTISPDDAARKRLRLQTDRGTDCAISLSRKQDLSDGAVLFLSQDQAIVVRHSERKWLALQATDQASALELGYFIGNLHWKVRFEDDRILVALQGPLQTYLDRLEALLSAGRIIRPEPVHG